MTITSSAADGSLSASVSESKGADSACEVTTIEGEGRVGMTTSQSRALDASPLPSASSSTSSPHNNPLLGVASDLDESSMTPPLPDGQSRPNPLVDEQQSDEAKKVKGTGERNDPVSKSTLDANTQDAFTQYPSPSSGFVPPVTEQYFKLGAVPAPGISSKGELVRSGSEVSSVVPASLSEADAETLAGSMALAKEDGSPSRRDSMERTAEDLTSSLSIPRPLSASSNTSSPCDSHSQAISARSSPSTVAPKRRASSFSPLDQSSSAQQLQGDEGEGSFLIPLKIRDYAFPELDPRHVGARDVSAPNPVRQQAYLGGEGGWRGGADFDDDEDNSDQEDEEEAGQSTGLPTGLYHAAYDFVGESEHELSVKAGQKVRLIGHVDGGWAIVVRVAEGEEDKEVCLEEEKTDVDKGLVPEAYLEWLG